MKNYYIALMAFTQVNERDDIDEDIFHELARDLRKAFEALESWEKDMLQHTINFEVSEVIL